MEIYVPIVIIKIALFICAVLLWFKVYGFVHAMYEKCYPAQSIGEDFGRGSVNLVLFIIPVLIAVMTIFGNKG